MGRQGLTRRIANANRDRNRRKKKRKEGRRRLVMFHFLHSADMNANDAGGRKETSIKVEEETKKERRKNEAREIPNVISNITITRQEKKSYLGKQTIKTDKIS